MTAKELQKFLEQEQQQRDVTLDDCRAMIDAFEQSDELRKLQRLSINGKLIRFFFYRQENLNATFFLSRFHKSTLIGIDGNFQGPAQAGISRYDATARKLLHIFQS